MTPEIEKFLKEIEMVSQKAKKANINAFIHKYSDLLEIPF